ncbi:MAG: RNA polymerase sigma factor [Deltaproteobacteria bacterium]|nr:RNA polymerase sigma factor [Deltaproteobacteria bacterium]
MQRVAADDPRACRMVALRLATRVRRLTTALLGSGSVAEDAAQQSLLELLRGAHGFRGACSLEYWCDRICSRVALRMATRERTHAHTAGRIDPDELAGAVAIVMPDAVPKPILHYLAALDEDQRQALVLRHVADHSIPEIAALTGVGESTVKYRINAALRTIRKAIARDRLRTVPLRGAL